MADPGQVARLRQSVARWNQWRRRHPAAAIDLREADLCGADLRGADLREADLRGATMHWVNLEAGAADAHALQSAAIAATLRGVREVLAGRSDAGSVPPAQADRADGGTAALPPDGAADLSGAQLAGVDLVWTNLRGVDFTGADMRRANLAGARLEGAVLTRARLEGANLSDANLTGAATAGADFTGVRSAGARGLVAD